MYLCIDIGGTKTLIALFSRYGRVVKKLKFKTAEDKSQFIDELVANLRGFVNPHLKAVAVAIPGHVRFEQNIYSAKLGNRDWGWFDIYTPIKSLFNCPIYFENDANLAAIYESKGLRGKTVFLTFSTGIGGGVAENGRLLVTDEDGFEPGHQIYHYNGADAEWEDIAAASALEKYFNIHPATDIRGKAAMEEIAKRVALGIPDIIKMHHPNNIVLGGPLGKIFRLYVKYLPRLGVKYRRPKRPLESVIYGAYLFAKGKTK